MFTLVAPTRPVGIMLQSEVDGSQAHPPPGPEHPAVYQRRLREGKR